MTGAGWRAWVPEAVLAGWVLVVGGLEGAVSWRPGAATVPVLGVALAVLLARKAPATALGVLWALGLVHVLLGLPVLAVELAAVVVAFGCARWGRPATVVLSGMSIPVAAVVAAYLVRTGRYGLFPQPGLLQDLVSTASRLGSVLVVGVGALGLLLLALPWLAGLALRFMARARRSEVSQQVAEEDAARAQREAFQAQEIARLREEQARLARDVHDVVGHSLAVILAQAESVQYLPDDEPEAIKQTVATIATSARTSLQDVRAVLSAAPRQTARPGSLDELLERVRSGGHEVLSHEVGVPRPMPPELEVVAFHVLQEMLTNAIRHGRREDPVTVERHWPESRFDDDLRIEVRNVEGAGTGDLPATPAGDPAGHGGLGIDGMRRRLESVGGRLDVRRRETPEGARTFTVTAWVPVRAGTA